MEWMLNSVAWGIRIFYVLSLVMWPRFWWDFYERKPKIRQLSNWWQNTGLPDVIFMILRNIVVIGFIVWAITAPFIS